MTFDPTDYELGEDVTDQVSRAKRPGLVVSARLDSEDARKLLGLARESNRTVSQITREAVHGYILQAELTRQFQFETTWSRAGVVITPESVRKTYVAKHNIRIVPIPA